MSVGGTGSPQSTQLFCTSCHDSKTHSGSGPKIAIHSVQPYGQLCGNELPDPELATDEALDSLDDGLDELLDELLLTTEELELLENGELLAELAELELGGTLGNDPLLALKLLLGSDELDGLDDEESEELLLEELTLDDELLLEELEEDTDELLLGGDGCELLL